MAKRSPVGSVAQSPLGSRPQAMRPMATPSRGAAPVTGSPVTEAQRAHLLRVLTGEAPPPPALQSAMQAQGAMSGAMNGMGMGGLGGFGGFGALGAPPDNQYVAGGEVPSTRAAQRVVTPAGSLFPFLRPTNVEPFDSSRRVLGDDRLYDPDISPTNPVYFDVGVVGVELDEILAITEYEFKLFRVGTTGTQPYEPEMFSDRCAFDLVVDGARSQRNTTFVIDPQPIPTQTTPIISPVVPSGSPRLPPEVIEQSGAANQFFKAWGAGLAALPNRPDRFGPTQGPFTLWVGNGGVVVGRFANSLPMPAPIAFIQMEIRGYKFSARDVQSLIAVLGI